MVDEESVVDGESVVDEELFDNPPLLVVLVLLAHALRVTMCQKCSQ